MSADVIDLFPLPATADLFGFAPIPEVLNMKAVEVVERSARVLDILERDLLAERGRHEQEMYRIQTAMGDLADQLARFAASMRTANR